MPGQSFWRTALTSPSSAVAKQPKKCVVILSELRTAAAGGRERQAAISAAAPLCGLSRSRPANGNRGKVRAKDPVRLRMVFLFTGFFVTTFLRMTEGLKKIDPCSP